MTTLDAAFDDADLHGFVDGRIEAGRGAALAAALAADPEARARLDGWRRQNDHLRTLFAGVLVEPVPVRLVPTGPALSPRRPAPAGAAGRPGRGAAAALGLALVGFALGTLAGRGPLAPERAAPREAAAPGETLASRAAEAHRTYLSDGLRPVEFGPTEEPRFARWIQRRLGAALRAPDLRGLGWTLLGARAIPGADGPAAFLVYGGGGGQLALTVGRPGRRPPADGPRPADDPVQVAAWTDGDLALALTTTLGRDWLAREGAALRDSVRAQMRGADAPP